MYGLLDWKRLGRYSSVLNLAFSMESRRRRRRRRRSRRRRRRRRRSYTKQLIINHIEVA